MLEESNKDLSFSNNVIIFRKGKDMDDVLHARELLRHGFPETRYGSVKGLLYEAQRYISRKVKKEFTHRRTRSIWEGTARRIDSEEMDALRLAVIEESKREQHELRARLASLDAMLASVDEAFHGETLAALRAQQGGLGGIHHNRKDRG